MRPIIEKTKEIDKIKIYLSLFKLHKSYLLLISDQENQGIGNVTLGSPSTIEGMKASSVTHLLFGVQRNLLSKIIVEKTTSYLNAPVLLLLFLKSVENESEIAKTLILFLNEALNEISNNSDK